MNSSELFNEMKKAHETYRKEKGVLAEENALFIRYATLLARNEEENPFKENTLEYDDYYDFMYFYHKWPQSKPACAFKTAFLDRAEKLCEYNNPFEKNEDNIDVVSLDELQEIEHGLTEIEDIMTETYVPVKNEPPKKVLGVLPEKKSHRSRRNRK